MEKVRQTPMIIYYESNSFPDILRMKHITLSHSASDKCAHIMDISCSLNQQIYVIQSANQWMI